MAPILKNAHELRSFLGTITYYGKFIPNAATMLHALNQLLQKDTKWKWSRKCQRSFELAKQQLTSASVLTHYTPSFPIRMAADTSVNGIGAVIAHVFPDKSEHPVVLQLAHSPAVSPSIHKLRKRHYRLCSESPFPTKYLYGHSFTLVTNHKSLLAILGPKKGGNTIHCSGTNAAMGMDIISILL